MKRTVKVVAYSKHAKVIINDNGDCYDLVACEDVTLSSNKVTLVSLGIAMKLPSGCYARIYDRSSTPYKKGFRIANSVGIIDNSYSGNNDFWRYAALPITATKKTPVVIKEGDKICQFEICLSQKATVWQKIKWLFTNGYKFKYVNSLNDPDRNGFGSTGK